MNKLLFVCTIVLSSLIAWANGPVAPEVKAFIASIVGANGNTANDIINGSSSMNSAYVPWISKHGMSASNYQTEFNQLSSQGYRLQYVSGYSSQGTAKYNAIWEKVAGSQLSTRHGMTANTYQEEFNNHLSQGFRLKLVNGYTVNGIDYYAAIWDKSPGPPQWVAKHGLTSSQYQAEFNQLSSQGYRLVHISGYGHSYSERYAAIWHKSFGPAWNSYHGLSGPALDLENAIQQANGFQLKTLESYSISGVTKYVAIWEENQNVHMYNFGFNGNNYQTFFDNVRHQGYRPTSISGTGISNGARFSSVWKNTEFTKNQLKFIDQIVKNEMVSANLPAVSIAISKEGRLVYAKAFGKANIAANKEANVFSLFRVASVSKPITATAILKLVQNQQIELTDKIFGTNSILGNDFTSNYRDQRVMDINVKQLLQHTSGLWGSGNYPDPMFNSQYSGLTQSDLIRELLEDKYLDSPPDFKYAYSNFGYLILGRVIEKVTGMNYRDWIKQNILLPIGINSMDLANNSINNPLPKEVRYYGSNPYGIDIERMDSHGGWAGSAKDLVAFMVHIDGLGSPLDLISAQSYYLMGVGSNHNYGYGLGLAVNSNGNRWHDGSLPGSQAILVSNANQMSWAALTNSRENDPNLDDMMWDIVNGVSSWPSYNLFPIESTNHVGTLPTLEKYPKVRKSVIKQKTQVTRKRFQPNKVQKRIPSPKSEVNL